MISTMRNLSRFSGPILKVHWRIAPRNVLASKKKPYLVRAIPNNISASFVERQNLNLRMQNRRFTRLTNGFSKKARIIFTRWRCFMLTTILRGFIKPCELLRRWQRVAKRRYRRLVFSDYRDWLVTILYFIHAVESFLNQSAGRRWKEYG